VQILLRAAIASVGPEALDPEKPGLLVTIRLDGVLATPIDRGALMALMGYANAPDRSPGVDFSPSIRPDFVVVEQAPRSLLADGEPLPRTGQERVMELFRPTRKKLIAGQSRKSNCIAIACCSLASRSSQESPSKRTSAPH
jgi:hypothetical protein